MALGNFDGFHRGHAKIIEKIRVRADRTNAIGAILTFAPHPPRIVRPDKAPALLMTKEQKLEHLADAGIEGAAVVRFTPEMSRLEPAEFVRTVLVEWLHVSEVWVGSNFLFGRDRSGNFNLLKSLGGKYGFRVDKIDPVRYKDFVVSSTRIRRLIADGNVDEAGALLGHHYSVEGEVVRGAGRGREQGFPTANIRSENDLMPRHGVYASTVTVEGIIYPAVTNIGVRPTFEEQGEEVVESHLFDFEGDLYETRIALDFVIRIRDEHAFKDESSLRRQIAADCQEVKSLFDRMSL